MIRSLQDKANIAVVERRDLEAAEAGRRQREGLEYPEDGGEDLLRKYPTTDM